MRRTAGEDAGRERVGSAVGQFDGMMEVAGTQDGQHRSKNLLLPQRACRIDVGEDVRSYKPASVSHATDLDSRHLAGRPPPLRDE